MCPSRAETSRTPMPPSSRAAYARGLPPPGEVQTPSGEHRRHDRARAHPQSGAPADDTETRDDRSDRSERNPGLSLTDLVW